MFYQILAVCLSRVWKLTGPAWYAQTTTHRSHQTNDPQESKLFDVANSLADVMIIMPSMNHESHFGIGPRDLIHSLSQVLSSFRGGNPAVISILQDKLTQLGMAIASPQKLLELSSPEEEKDDWHGERSMSAPSSYSSSYPAGSPISPTYPPDLTIGNIGSQSPTFPSSMSVDGNY